MHPGLDVESPSGAEGPPSLEDSRLPSDRAGLTYCLVCFIEGESWRGEWRRRSPLRNGWILPRLPQASLHHPSLEKQPPLVGLEHTTPTEAGQPACPGQQASELLCCLPRYLVPCSHVMLSQKRAVKELDLYGRAASRFLSLIPRCCRPESPLLPEREEEHATWSKGEWGAPVTPRVSWAG